MLILKWSGISAEPNRPEEVSLDARFLAEFRLATDFSPL